MAFRSTAYAIALSLALSGCASTGSPSEETLFRTIGILESTPAKGVALTWPGSAVETVFTGEQLSVTISDSGVNALDVTIDNRTSAIQLQSGRYTYPLIDAEPGTYNVRIALRTERADTPTIVSQFNPGDGSLMVPATRPLQMLVIGDDITTGYGIEGEDQYCKYSKATQNANLSFAAIAGDILDADVTMVARSGRGLIRNWGDDSARTMRDLYTDIMRSDATRLPPTMDAVIVHLGTMDFADNLPGTDFDMAYVSFLETLRADFPKAEIIAGWGPMGKGLTYEAGNAAVMGAVELRRAAGDRNIAFMAFSDTPDGQLYGCDWHPSADTQRFMGEALAIQLQEMLASSE
ncbi:MAG: GDSL-type esterase/lipase family protein [Pseudomonadota bacterium]